MEETKFNDLKQNYNEYTDKYFLRTREILEKDGINPVVRYQVFARKAGIVKGVDDAVRFVKSIVRENAKVYALKDGDSYSTCEPLMKLEGRVQDLVDLETVYLGLISSGLTGEIDLQKVRKNAKEIVKAALGKPVFYFGARHFHPFLDKDISKICYEEGFVGASTDIGAKEFGQQGLGTIPHALIMSYAANLLENKIKGNPTVVAAKAFDKYIDNNVPRIVLIDSFNREIYDSIKSAETIQGLKGIRIDTCGENYSQDSMCIWLPYNIDVPEKYLRGKGVTIAGVWTLREALDDDNFPNLEITVSSGFNAEKTKAFLTADKKYQSIFDKPLFDAIGSGSLEDPVMATSDIVAYFSEKQNKWMELHKVGRKEFPSDRLQEVKTI